MAHQLLFTRLRPLLCVLVNTLCCSWRRADLVALFPSSSVVLCFDFLHLWRSLSSCRAACSRAMFEDHNRRSRTGRKEGDCAGHLSNAAPLAKSRGPVNSFFGRDRTKPGYFSTVWSLVCVGASAALIISTQPAFRLQPPSCFTRFRPGVLWLLMRTTWLTFEGSRSAPLTVFSLSE